MNRQSNIIHIGQYAFFQPERQHGRAIVYAVHGAQNTGAATFDVVFEDTHTIRTGISEREMRGELWHVFARVANDESLASVLAQAVIARASQQAAETLKRRRDEQMRPILDEADELRDDPRYSRLKHGSDPTSGRLAATNIRTELKSAHPDVAFTVRRLSCGDISIRWIDGPPKADVDALVQHYDGARDGTVSAWHVAFGGTARIRTLRHASDQGADSATIRSTKTFSP
jgi:hypothetical protein